MGSSFARDCSTGLCRYGVLPGERSVRTVFSVCMVVHSTRCGPLAIMFLFNRYVESRLGHVINSKQPPCAPTRKISHTRTRTERESVRCARPRETESERRARDVQKTRHKNHEPKTMYNGDNAQWSMQMSIQVASAKDACTPGTPRARTQAHTHTTHRETRHIEIAQITVTERARQRSSVGKLGGPPTPFAPHRPFG